MEEEIINNCIKYSEAKNLYISIQLENKKLIFKMQDDGKGFDIVRVHLGNGINNIKKRIAELNGTLELIADLEKGTYYQYTIPIDETHI